MVESRGWNAKVCSRPGRSRTPPSALGQSRLANLALAARLNLTLEGCSCFNPRFWRSGFFGKPHFVNCKNITRSQNHGPLNAVLQLSDVAWPGVGLKQL